MTTRPEQTMIRMTTQEKIQTLYNAYGWTHQQRIDFSRAVCHKPWPQTEAEGRKLLTQLTKARPVSASKQTALARLYKDFGWDVRRQEGFNLRTCGKPQPETQVEANQIYHGLEEILKRLLRPHYAAFERLVRLLMANRAHLTAWERETFLPSIAGKLATPEKISAKMVKKVREIAHKHHIDCGFPPFRELADAYNTDCTARQATTQAGAGH